MTSHVYMDLTLQKFVRCTLLISSEYSDFFLSYTVTYIKQLWEIWQDCLKTQLFRPTQITFKTQAL